MSLELYSLTYVAFFLAFGINCFVPRRWLMIVAGVAAIILAVLEIILIFGK